MRKYTQLPCPYCDGNDADCTVCEGCGEVSADTLELRHIEQENDIYDYTYDNQ
jgi:hypothetical protein